MGGFEVQSSQGDVVNIQNETLEIRADLLAEEALHELGDIPLDEPDECDVQCDYAGCFPWLADVICAHPHDSVALFVLHGGDAAEEDPDYFC